MRTETMEREGSGTLSNAERFDVAEGIFLEGLRAHLADYFGFDREDVEWCEGDMSLDCPPAYEVMSFTVRGRGWTWRLATDDVSRDDHFDEEG